jgi:small-conductance mechanosensitive channel
MIGEPLKEPIHKDVAEKVETLTVDTYGWIKADSETAISAVGIAVALYFAFFGLRWALGRLLGDNYPITHWRGFTRRIVKRTRSPFIAVFSAFIVTHVVETPLLLQRAVAIAFTVAFAIQGALWLREILLALVDRRAAESEPGELDSAINIIKVMVNVVVWVLAAILILDNLGVNVTALVAGLGVGGIAIGLAAQGIFSDLFAALSILFDRPFRVGDTIRFGEVTGSVEAIGLKTTRIRAITGHSQQSKVCLDLITGGSVNEPVTLHHATRVAVHDSIVNNGLRPGGLQVGTSGRATVFFTTTEPKEIGRA